MLKYNMNKNSVKYTSQTYTFLYYEKYQSKNFIKKYNIISSLLSK